MSNKISFLFKRLNQSAAGKMYSTFQRYPFQVHKSVSEGIKQLKPVLALESTIITHGMPYPDNLETALQVEEIARQHDVIPATIGVINGKVHVGMYEEQLIALATCCNAKKLSKRDLPVACVYGYTGGTTVSATMFIANSCGIKVFATGGIGGVHRMGEHTLDISADLKELGQNPITLVCAGVKSILDIKRTLEYLETEGVTVATIGNDAKNFPAFFTRSSKVPSPANVESVNQAVTLMQHHKDLNIASGVLFAVPIPNKFAAQGIEIENAIEKAVCEASDMNIEGNKVTPYILRRVNELTKGQSLKANISLIKNNVKIGAQIAKKYMQYQIPGNSISGSCQTIAMLNNERKCGKPPVVIGGSNIDIVSKCSSAIQREGPSNRSTIVQSLGGVARNIAEALSRLNIRPYFISAVGSDHDGSRIIKDSQLTNTDGFVKVNSQRTGVYIAMFNHKGELDVAAEDTEIHKNIDVSLVKENLHSLKESPLVCVDANIPLETMQYICEVCSRSNIPILYEPTGELKAADGYMAKGQCKQAISYMTPNVAELSAIYEASSGFQTPYMKGDCFDGLDKSDLMEMDCVTEMCDHLLQFTPNILVTLGAQGVLHASAVESERSAFIHYPLRPRPSWNWLEEPVANTSGCGDSFTAGFIYGLLENPDDVDRAIRIGITISQRTLRSSDTISRNICKLDTFVSHEDWRGTEIKRITKCV